MFMNEMKNTLNTGKFNESYTENSALSFRTSGKELLDLNFAVASLRGATDETIMDMFMKAFYEDKILAMKWLFYARDIRGSGLGERNLFRVVMSSLAKDYPAIVTKLISLIPEYGRFDDLWCLLDTDFKANIIEMVRAQLTIDIANMKLEQPTSLLAKWMPSINASSPITVRYAKILCKGLRLSSKIYRKTLVALRAYIDVVEVKMSAKRWDEIKYEAVPSKANLVYNGAFLKNDEDRRRGFLSALEKGETKINSSVLYPHDIVHKYKEYRRKDKDIALEEMWKALPNTVLGCGNTMVVADGSGSMRTTISKTCTTALDVAQALSIYFAERSSGQFKDKYITFSERPQFVDLSQGKSLIEKILIANRFDEVANTNIEAVFELILATAVRGKMSQSNLPNNVLVISDMEFDQCAEGTYGTALNKKLFEVIGERFVAAGYQLPRLVFWNVNSRTKAIPVIENDLGVALVSGFSTNIVKMVMSNKADPYECLIEALSVPRYQVIEDLMKA